MKRLENMKAVQLIKKEYMKSVELGNQKEKS